MTCIVAYKDKKNNRVYIGADSCMSSECTSYILKDNCKLFKPKGNNRALIGISGNARSGQLLRYSLVFPNEAELRKIEVTEGYIVCEIIPLIKDILDANNLLSNGKSEIFITLAYKDKMWIIDDDFAVAELKQDYVADGSGYAYAEGSLHTTKNMDISIEDKVLMGLRAGCIESHVAPPFFIMNTADDEIIKKEG